MRAVQAITKLVAQSGVMPHTIFAWRVKEEEVCLSPGRQDLNCCTHFCQQPPGN